MDLMYSIFLTLAKSTEKLTAYFSKENAKKVSELISYLESVKKDNDKFKQSMNAIEQLKLEELKKLEKKKEEFDLRYSGDIIDLKEEEFFQKKLASIKMRNDCYRAKMENNLAELESDYSVLINEN